MRRPNHYPFWVERPPAGAGGTGERIAGVDAFKAGADVSW